jgi:enoyl-CoA hydratase / 3-hydroxyacyl-CoA dehydrogenase
MSNIKKIAVLGSGVMGHGIAQISAAAGYSVTLRDIEETFLQKAMDKIKWSLSKLVEKKKLLRKTLTIYLIEYCQQLTLHGH